MTWRTVGRGLSAFGAAVLLIGAAGGAVAQSPSIPEVRVAEGVVRGQVVDGVRVFRAIPYAAAPVGALRFRAPQPPKAWSGVLDAASEGPACPQVAGGDPAAKASVDEDCLRLNVFTPARGQAGSRRPVMVWIHGGGGGASGYGGARFYDPTAMVKEGGVVAVSINYRLGTLGLLAASSLNIDGELSGNYAYRDQQAALRWVQRNIAAFGGDPANVTIVGGTAGAQSVLALVVSPLSKGLFAKSIAISPPAAAHVNARARMELGGAELAEALGCKAGAEQATCLRELPVAKLLSTRGRLGIVEDPGLFPIDTFDALRDGRFNRGPMITGSALEEGNLTVSEAERRLGRPMTSEEAATQIRSAYGPNADALLKLYPFAAYASPAAAVSALSGDASFACYIDLVRAGASKHAPAYGFEMNEPDPAQQQPRPKVSLANAAYHTTDLAYLFNIAAGGQLKGKDAALGRKMRAYLAQFMRTGSPNGGGLPEWPRFEKGAVLNLSNAGGVTADFAKRHHCDALRDLGIVYAGLR